MADALNRDGGRRRPVFRALSGAFISSRADDEKTIIAHMKKPSLKDNVDDLKRLTDAIEVCCGSEIVSADIDVVRSLPVVARESDWTLKCTICPENEYNEAGDKRIVRTYFLKRIESGLNGVE